MSARRAPWLAGALAALLAAAFALSVRLPLPFGGFAALSAAGLAGLGTLALIALAPPAWIWTEAERLRLAFAARHDMAPDLAGAALAAIVQTHARAEALRQAAEPMRDDMADQVTAIADRLDAAAREIFYVPDRLRDLRAVLTRSELIEEAAAAHAALRRRAAHGTDEASRAKLAAAITALDLAFDRTELKAAQGLLQEVDVASSVAERLLTPARPLSRT
ncbi:MAG: hypothetical protein AAGF60_10795 [Pseudomonadota bacterium]